MRKASVYKLINTDKQLRFASGKEMVGEGQLLCKKTQFSNKLLV